MSEKLDLTKPGGFPMTQNKVKIIHDAIHDGLSVLAAINQEASTTPVVIKGMAVSGGGNTVADGWFFYNGELIQFTGSTVTPTGGHVALVLITTTVTPVTYRNGAINSSIIKKTGSLIQATSVTDATHFPVTALRPWVAHDPWIDVINDLLDEFLGGWVDQQAMGLNPTSSVISCTGGGTFTGGTVAYSRWHNGMGQTLMWQIALDAYTIAGTVNTITIRAPHHAITPGQAFVNAGRRGWCTMHFGGAGTPVEYILENDIVNGPQITLSGFGVAFPTSANVNFDIEVIAELS